MSLFGAKSLAVSVVLALSAATAQAATIDLFALPSTAVANPLATSTSGHSVWENIVGNYDHPR